MIIDKHYIAQRINEIINEKQSGRQAGRVENKASFVSFQNFWHKHVPEWVKNTLTPMLIPVFLVWKKGKERKKKNRNTLPYSPLSIFSTDFIHYCFNKNPYLDTSLYFEQVEDKSGLKEFIDNKIKCFLAGFDQYPINSIQRQDIEYRKQLRKKAKMSKGGFCLQLPERKYYLPNYTHFTPATFVYHYGLAGLHPAIKQYMAGKDFLDVGALYGDVSLMLLQYNPNHIYAYEPVAKSYRYLTDTIQKNNVANHITAIRKGLADRQGQMAISVLGGSSSLNQDFHKNNPTEIIEITTIDRDCEDKTIGLIKMDVEGYEYFVLRGGLETIKRDRPVLLISIYHTGKDFFEIPPMLKESHSGYTFRFLDIYPSHPLGDKIIVGYDQSIVV